MTPQREAGISRHRTVYHLREMSIEITKLAVLSLKILSLGDRKEKSSRRGQEASISSVPGNEVLEGNRCPSPMCGITFYNTRRIKRLPWPQSGTPPQRPNLQLFRPNKDSTRPLPRPLRRPGPASSRCLPRTSRSKRIPHLGLAPSARGPARPALRLPTGPEDPLAPPGGGGGGGGSRVRENPTKWRRPLEPRRDRALSRAPAHARASARCLRPLPLAGAGRPIPRPHTNGCSRLGSQPPRHGGGASW